MAESLISLPDGTMLNQRYEINQPLNSGGFSITYIAWDKTLQMKTVIKEYMPKRFMDRKEGTTEVILRYAEFEQTFNEGVSDFLKEARILARFTYHRGIAGVIDYFSENNTAYIVMPYCEGITLSEYISSIDGRVGYKECIALLTPVMDALADVHMEGIVHRDISPENILITKNGKAVLLDFGASEVIAITKGMQNESLKLKHGYAPPEQYYAGGIQGPWTDVYAMAATLYYCICGEHPQPAIQRMHKDTIIDLHRAQTSIPVYVSDAITKALSLASEDRFQNMNALIRALTSFRLPIRAATVAKMSLAAAMICIGIFGGYMISKYVQTTGAYVDEAASTETVDVSSSQETAETQEGGITMQPTTVPTQVLSDDTKKVDSDYVYVELNQSDVVTFADANLEAAVREAIGKLDGDIIKREICDIRELKISSKGIQSLEGIQHFSQLTWLDISNNMVQDLTPIIHLEYIWHMDAGGNLIENIDMLEGCVSICELGLSSNYVEDISVLESLVNLIWLDINGNKITEVSAIGGLPKLQWLNLAGNKVTDISCLAECPRIEELCADGMGINDISAFDGHPSLEKLQY